MRASLIFLFLLSLSGCASIYGIKVQSAFDEEKVNLFISSNNYKSYANSILDKPELTQMRSIAKDSISQKYLSQPIQIYYLNNNQLVSYHVNCNAGGFPKLAWNRNNNFSTCPPKNQTNLTDFDVNKFKKIVGLPTDDKENIVVVFWNLLMEKQSVHTINTVLENLKLSPSKSKVYLINNDKWYIN